MKRGKLSAETSCFTAARLLTLQGLASSVSTLPIPPPTSGLLLPPLRPVLPLLLFAVRVAPVPAVVPLRPPALRACELLLLLAPPRAPPVLPVP